MWARGRKKILEESNLRHLCVASGRPLVADQPRAPDCW
jgi:hypothetical protein